jgi:hypothetical protein
MVKYANVYCANGGNVPLCIVVFQVQLEHTGLFKWLVWHKPNFEKTRKTSLKEAFLKIELL